MLTKLMQLYILVSIYNLPGYYYNH